MGITVSDLDRSKAFYTAALAPLGYGVVMEVPGVGVGFGANRKPSFWIGKGEVKGSVHVAFVAKDRAAVEAFHAAALAAGGKDNGPAGLRPHYHPGYYGAFVQDPDGHNAEAVVHEFPPRP